MKICTYLFNWRGQYENTKEKIKQLEAVGVTPTIINSDDEHNDKGWVNLGESAFFTDLFIKALELFDGDIFCHIQGDASYDKWKQLYDDALKYYEKYEWGVYAPNVDYTWYNSSRTDIDSIVTDDENLKVVACPDCTCWFINKDIIEEFKARKINMKPYTMGWGWDIIFPGISFLNKRPVLRDYNHTIQHPEGTNYNKDKAEREMQELFNSLPEDLKTMFYYIKGDRNQIAKVFSGD